MPGRYATFKFASSRIALTLPTVLVLEQIATTLKIPASRLLEDVAGAKS